MEKFNLLQTLDAYIRCCKSNNAEWIDKHWGRITENLLEVLPHGSGIDYDWHFFIADNGKDLCCANGFHWMNDMGYYCGTIDFVITIKAGYRDMFGKLIIKIVGQFGKQQDLKDYLYEVITESLDNF